MDLYTFVMIWVCVCGLCMGSFYNVVILRSLSGESIVFPPSKCPKCNHKLYFWHNIPVLSYILLKGKCYFCKEKISIQYPIIELLTMILFGLSVWRFGLNYTTIFVILWLSCMLIMVITDIKERVADCNLAIAVAVSGLLYFALFNGWHGVLHSILGLCAGVLIMELIARSGFLIAKTRAMGEADTYVAGAIGAVCGIFMVVKVLLYSLYASMIFIIPVFLYKKYKVGDRLTCILSAIFMLSIIIFYLWLQNYWSLAFLILIGLALAYSIMRGIKNENDRIYLPFVPALAIGLSYYIFFLM